MRLGSSAARWGDRDSKRQKIVSVSTAKDKMVLAALDLLRHSGLSGAGINTVVDVSGAPKGSVYHYFPGGKHDLVATALERAERSVGDGLRSIFGQPTPLAQKVRSLFATTGNALEGKKFTRGCPVAAVTLDIDQESEKLRRVCGAIFDAWRDIVAAGLHKVPDAERRDVAQLILATLEGAMILSRAQATKAPLLRAGAWLADVLEFRFPSSASKGVSKERRPPRRRLRSP